MHPTHQTSPTYERERERGHEETREGKKGGKGREGVSSLPSNSSLSLLSSPDSQPDLVLFWPGFLGTARLLEEEAPSFLEDALGGICAGR